MKRICMIVALGAVAWAPIAMATPTFQMPDLLRSKVKRSKSGPADAAAQLYDRLKTFDKSPNATDAKGRTMLMLAAELDDQATVCYLVARGAEVTPVDKQGKTAHDYALSPAIKELLAVCANSGNSGPALSHEGMERKAQEMGLDTPQARRDQLWKLASRPGKLSEMQELLQLDVDMSGPGVGGLTLAEVKGLTPEYLAYLVRRGYNINSRGEQGTTPLRGDITAPMARLLLALGLQVDAQDPLCCLWAALFANDTKEVQALLRKDANLIQQRTEDDRPLLALAQSRAMVQLLIKAGADASEAGLLSGLIARSAEDSCPAEVVAELIAAGAALPQDALITLCRSGKPQAALIKALMAAGADATEQDAEGNTLLHLILQNKAAAACAPEAVKALIKAQVNPKAKNAAGQSALQLAKSLGRDDLIKLMKKSASK